MSIIKKITVLILLSIVLSACHQLNEPEATETIVNNYISIVWKGSYNEALTNPEIGWAYYNTVEGKSYIWDGVGWEILAQDGISIVWKGEYPNPPESPQLNWAYYNIVDGNSYIWDGSEWNLLARAGNDGVSGILLWLGSLADSPNNPSKGDAYYNTTKKTSYIWDGESWKILAQDGTDGINGTDGLSIVWKGATSSAPTNPEKNWAYYNTIDKKSYIWTGDKWDVITESLGGDTTITVGIIWKGELTVAPGNPFVGWMYYNKTLNKTYIWDGSSWNIVAQDGISPTGFLIVWKGAFSTAPSNPVKGWAYYNLDKGKSYIWDGDSWEILAQDGADGSNGIDAGSGTSISSGEIVILKDGDTIPYFEIPVINAGETTSVVFEIKNTGSSTLYLTGSPLIEIESDINSSAFTIDLSETESSIEAGESTFFTLKYSPTVASSKVAAKLVIRTSDISINQSTFYVYGSAKSPGMYLSLTVNGTNYLEYPYMVSLYPSSADTYSFTSAEFGNVLVNDFDTGSITIMNTGPNPYDTTLDLIGFPAIQVTGADADCFIVTQPTNTSIVTSKYTSATIKFLPTSLGEKTALVTIPNNTPEKPNFSFTVTGKGIALASFFITFDKNDAEASGSMDVQNITSGTSASLNINKFSKTGYSFSGWATTPTGNVVYSDKSEFTMGEANITLYAQWVETANVTINTWPKSFDGSEGDGDDCITCSACDSQDNLYFIGYGYELVYNYSGYDWWIKKIDTTGTEITTNWDKKLDINDSKSSSYDKPTNVVIDSTDNIYISDGYYTLKFSSDGTEDLNWHKNVGGTLYIDSSDAVYLVKSSNITKYSSAGNLLWTKTCNTSFVFDNNDDCIAFSGSSLQKISSSGDDLWEQTLSGFTINSVTVDDNNNVYVAGYGTDLYDTFSDKDVWIKKFNSSGVEVTTNWDKKIDWGNSNPEYATTIMFSGSSIFVSGSGEDLISGASETDGWIKAFSLEGQEDLAWDKVVNTSNQLLRIDGTGNVFYNSGSEIIKYDSFGDIQNTFNYSGFFSYNGYNYRYIYVHSFLFDSLENLYVSGCGYNFITSESSSDWVIRKFDSTGAVE